MYLTHMGGPSANRCPIHLIGTRNRAHLLNLTASPKEYCDSKIPRRALRIHQGYTASPNISQYTSQVPGLSPYIRVPYLPPYFAIPSI